MYLLILFIFIPNISLADIFSKPTDQGPFNTALAKDPKNYYYRSGFDYNASETRESSPYELQKSKVSLGCNRYDFHESLKNLFTRPEFDDAELEVLMQQLSLSRFMVWQYSSPSVADLYKHLDTMGHLQLGMRYHQCEDLERSVDDPIIKLRKQAIMDCIKRKEGSSEMNDIDLAFKSCFDSLSSIGDLKTPYGTLEDPGDGRFYISGTINVTEKTLDRVNKEGEDLTVIKQILPKTMLSNDTVTIQGPVFKSRELIAQYRSDFLSKLTNLIKNYKQNKAVNSQELADLSVFGVPLTEGQVKNIAMLDDVTSYLAMNKIASELGYLKTIDQYLKASQMLDRVMNHPAIENGYKTLLKNSSDFVQKEIVTLKEEKERLSQYATIMHAVLEEADRQRLQALSWIDQESIGEEQKGLLKLNP